MSKLPLSLQHLVNCLAKLPSVGEKSALRLAYHMLAKNQEQAQDLAEAITVALSSISKCNNCFFLSDNELCPLCNDSRRDSSVICVVEKSLDVIAMERSGEFRGLYHVLNTLWAPLKNQQPDPHIIETLKQRAANGVKEVILATGSTVEGDATALYLAKVLSECGVKTSRLAQGMPKGGELEYLDDLTLSRALSGRSMI